MAFVLFSLNRTFPELEELICPVFNAKYEMSFRARLALQQAVAVRNNYYDFEKQEFVGGFCPQTYMSEEFKEFQDIYNLAEETSGSLYISVKAAWHVLGTVIGEAIDERVALSGNQFYRLAEPQLFEFPLPQEEKQQERKKIRDQFRKKVWEYYPDVLEIWGQE